ncbi:hypothetical protein [Trichormus azollae]|jgi:hypothetical protein|uniref:hypothetical protein n=1 Tax=Trichormus azollae TaxID=1164 RepID=UPI0001957378
MPDVKRTDLVERTVYIAPPVRYKIHGEPHSNIMAWLGFYTAYYIGVEIANNASVRFDIV